VSDTSKTAKITKNVIITSTGVGRQVAYEVQPR